MQSKIVDFCQQNLRKVVTGGLLNSQLSQELFEYILAGEVDPILIAGIITALATRGETHQEVLGAAMALRKSMSPLDIDISGAIDCCGTGGTGRKMFNCSTASAFVVAAAGVKVAKHGNKSMNSPSGSANLLENAGVNLTNLTSVNASTFDELGICFMFAPDHHPAMRHAGPIRSTLKIQSIFNLLGPLCNPASVKRQLIGVAHFTKLKVIAQALVALETEHVLVVHAIDGLDEISPLAPTDCTEVLQKSIHTFRKDFRSYCGKGSYESLSIADAQESLIKVRSVLSGDKGFTADMVNINAAAAIAMSLDQPFNEVFDSCFERAQQAQESGDGLKLLEKFADASSHSSGN